MNTLSTFVLLGIAIVVAGCSSSPPRHACAHADLGLDLAGHTVKDCGILAYPASAEAQSKAQSCAKRALASRAPVRFGSGWVGSDAASCSVVVRDLDSQLWAIDHRYDISVELGEKLFVARCSSVTFPVPDARSWQHFEVAGCIADEPGFDRVSAGMGWKR
jgi:hypothetical protein